MSALRFDALGPAHVEQAVEMAAAEGWNPGLSDAAVFHAADPTAFTGAFEGEQLVACISIARYGEECGFLGFYLCATDRRGQGIGMSLWNAALEAAGPIAIALDGVVAQQENYARSGFEYQYTTIRHGGLALPLADTDWVQPLEICDPDALAAFDTAVFGMARPRYLAAWLGQPGAIGRYVVRDGTVRGYALRRPCRKGHKIGPLFAEDAATARALFTDLSEDIDDSIYLDTPAPNAAALSLARDAGLVPVFETARMVRGTAPTPNLSQTYGITSFEFG